MHSIANKKVLGKMKDECAGRPIAEYSGPIAEYSGLGPQEEYSGLRPKMYSILEVGGRRHQEGKGC